MKKVVIAVSVIVLLLVGIIFVYRIQTKSLSPESNVDFESGDLSIHLFYNRPSKRGRVIFGDLVPYGKVWRTGANEATYIETNKTLLIKGNELKEGKYSLWTIPGEQTWTIIFNSDYPSWGRTFDKESAHDPKADVVRVEVPAVIQEHEIELFTISLEKVEDGFELVFLWDKTLVSVPFTVSAQQP